MIKTILFTLLSVIALLAVVGLLLSPHYESARGVVIHAPAERVFSLIGDLKNWPQWEPFSKQDPTTKTTLGEKTSGVGASQTWVGDGNKGRLTFTVCDPKLGIDYDLVFTNGEHDSPAKSWMHMTPRPDGSVEVEWGISGEMNWPAIGGYFARIADRFMGPMFEDGLERLKATAEAQGSEAK